jgi:hypothetical protein
MKASKNTPKLTFHQLETDLIDETIKHTHIKNPIQNHGFCNLSLVAKKVKIKTNTGIASNASRKGVVFMVRIYLGLMSFQISMVSFFLFVTLMKRRAA